MIDFNRAIVIDDAGGELADGDVLDGIPVIEAARRRAALVLPYDRSHPEEPASGYFRRGFGWPGHRFDKMAGERGCAMMLYLHPGMPWIYWCAVLAPGGTDPRGTIRLASSTARQSAFSGGLSALGDVEVRVEELKLNEYPTGVAVGGRMRVNVVGEGYLLLSLWAVCKHVCVSVAAVSQCEGEYRYP